MTAIPGDHLEGSGVCIPQSGWTHDASSARAAEPFAEYRRPRTGLAAEGAQIPQGAVPFDLILEPSNRARRRARVPFFTTGATAVEGVPEPVLVSTNLARRSALAAELDRAAAERCDVYLTELKAAAIDTVAMRARAEGARVVFIRNRPTGIDDALVKLYRDANDPSTGHGLPPKGLIGQSSPRTALRRRRAFELASKIEQPSTPTVVVRSTLPRMRSCRGCLLARRASRTLTATRTASLDA